MLYFLNFIKDKQPVLPFKGTRAHISCCQSDRVAGLKGCTETSGGKAPHGQLARKLLQSTSGLVGEKEGLKDTPDSPAKAGLPARGLTSSNGTQWSVRREGELAKMTREQTPKAALSKECTPSEKMVSLPRLLRDAMLLGF